MNIPELTAFFEEVFNEIEDGDAFSPEQDQSLADWFSVKEMEKYSDYGTLIEERNEHGDLIGALFIGKQNPISWPDGNKMEIFILGVKKEERGKGIAKKIIEKAEQYAQGQGAKKILINTHILQDTVQAMYIKLGYEKMGVLQDYYDNGDAVFFGKDV